MTYYSAKELARSFRTVRKNTITIAEEIGEEHYGFQASPDCRTVGQILTHIALTSRLAQHIHGTEHLSTLEGFDFMGFFGQLMAEEQTPRGKKEIVALLVAEGDQFAGWLESLTDEVLGEIVSFSPEMTPPSKSRFEMLLGVKEHEMHHRAQLMMMERMIGIVPHLTRAMNARIAEMQASAAAKASA
ncbi:MAG: DinB family protein [Bryobacteraceae bacterium]